MQLSFLGQAYTVSTPVVASTPTAEVASFMGQPYSRKQYQVEPQPVEPPQQPPAELSFMGQRYVRATVTEAQPLPCKPRPGEPMVNSRQLMQLQRYRASGRPHPAFRGS